MQTAVLIRQAEELLERAVREEREKNFASARRYYLLAAEALLRAAKESKGRVKEVRLRNAEKLLSITDRLPQQEAEGGESKGGRFLLRQKPEVSFRDVAGLEEVKQKIRELIIEPFLHPEKARKWGIKAGGGVLLYGPPGNGKTLLAKAVAGEAGAEFFYVKASDIMSKWVGESERRVAELFSQARACERAVIFIDEIDALLPKRSSGGSTVMQRVVPQFLAEMDGIGSESGNLLLLAATNVPWNLDPAALRPGRFDFRFYVSLPDFEARKRIFELNLQVPKEEGFDFARLAELTSGYSGADIKLICDEAKRAVFMREITSGTESLLLMRDVEEAISRVKPSVDRGLLRRYEEFCHHNI